MRNTDYIKGALLRDDYSGINDIEAEAGDLSDAAKYDVACTSSGVDRKGDGKGMGTALLPESVIVLLRMADVSVF